MLFDETSSKVSVLSDDTIPFSFLSPFVGKFRFYELGEDKRLVLKLVNN